RMQSLLFEENVWGSLSALISLCCMASFFRARLSKRIWALFMLATGCLLLSMSRGAIAAWVVGVIALLLLNGRHRFRIILTMIVLLFAMGAGIAVLRQDHRVAEFMKRLDRIGVTGGQFIGDRSDQWD